MAPPILISILNFGHRRASNIREQVGENIFSNVVTTVDYIKGLMSITISKLIYICGLINWPDMSIVFF